MPRIAAAARIALTTAALTTAALMLAAGMAHAQDINMPEGLQDAATGEELLDFVRQQGAEASLEQDGNGDPLIRATAGDEDLVFTIHTYDCEDRGDVRACKVITFRAAFETGDMPEVDLLRAANAWNATRIYGRAFVDSEGDANIDQVFSFWRGASPTSLKNAYNDFVAAMTEFYRELDR